MMFSRSCFTKNKLFFFYAHFAIFFSVEPAIDADCMHFPHFVHNQFSPIFAVRFPNRP